MGFSYIDSDFFIWAHGQDKPVSFATEFDNFHPNKKFTLKSKTKSIPVTHNT